MYFHQGFSIEIYFRQYNSQLNLQRHILSVHYKNVNLYKLENSNRYLCEQIQMQLSLPMLGLV